MFGVVQPDSPLWAPILGFFAITGIPTAGERLQRLSCLWLRGQLVLHHCCVPWSWDDSSSCRVGHGCQQPWICSCAVRGSDAAYSSPKTAAACHIGDAGATLLQRLCFPWKLNICRLPHLRLKRLFQTTTRTQQTRQPQSSLKLKCQGKTSLCCTGCRVRSEQREWEPFPSLDLL